MPRPCSAAQARRAAVLTCLAITVASHPAHADPPEPTYRIDAANALRAIGPRESFLAESPGRTEVHVTTDEPGQTVGVTAASPGADDDSSRDLHSRDLFLPLCEAPCTLYVPPGVTRLVTRGEATISTIHSVFVPAGGPLSLRVSPPTRHARGVSTGLFVPGIVLGFTGAIATALALSVAIPAVFGYNIFAHRLNRVDGELDGFGSELIALMVREGRI